MNTTTYEPLVLNPNPTDIQRIDTTSPEWPDALRGIDGAPTELWCRGHVGLLNLLDESISITGSRAASNYGETVADEFASELTERGYPVITGGGVGIDACVMRAALINNSRIIVVIPGGIDRFYPRATAELAEQIIATGGLVVSAQPCGTAPTRHRFLERNRLMAMLAQVFLLVESGARAAGTAAAEYAADKLEKPVAAVPGLVLTSQSSGCHRLIRQGAAELVTTAQHVIDLIRNDHS